MVLEVVKNLARGTTRHKSLIQNICAHDLTNRLKMRRKAIANDMGLEEWDVGSYPPNQVMINPPAGGLVKGALLSAGLLAAGGGATAGGLFLANRQEPAPVVETVEKIEETAIIEEQTFDQFMRRQAGSEPSPFRLEGKWLE